MSDWKVGEARNLEGLRYVVAYFGGTPEDLERVLNDFTEYRLVWLVTAAEHPYIVMEFDGEE